MILVRFQDKPVNITVIQVYAPTTNAEEAKVDQLYEDVQHFLEHQRIYHFHHRLLECKSRRSRDTCKTGKFGLGIQNEAGQRIR